MLSFEKRIASGADDVEQLTGNGNMYLGSSDLDLVVDGSANQQVGLRFTALDIPAGAVITAAYIQFQTDKRGSSATSLLIQGLDSDDTSPFTNRYYDLSSRATTSASASWQPSAWTIINEAGAAQRTPDLSMLVQEIIGRTGWQAGNDLGFVISGSGARTADSFDSSAANAPMLHIEYSLPSQSAAPVIDLDASAVGLGYTTVFSEDRAAVPIADSDVLITVSDDTNIERLTVTISNAKTGDQILLNGTLPTGIATDAGSTPTTLILIGSATAAAYEQALEQVRFDNNSATVDSAARQVQVTVNDGEATSSPATATIAIETGARTIEKRIASGADDVEQLTGNGNMYLSSSDLDLVVDGSANQQVGLRFTALDIPAGAVITAAYIQFQTDKRGSSATSLLIQGLDSDDTSPFTNRYYDLSSRATTSASASWQPQAWTIINEAGAAQRTPDLSMLVQEIIGRTGWQAGNDLGFVISGSGARTADSFNSSAANAPMLHVEYTLSPQSVGEIVLDLAPAFRENVAGATAGTLSVPNPAPGQSYVFSIADSRFEIVGTELKLRDGIRLDFERAPSVSLDITATASGGSSFAGRVNAPVIDVSETRFAAFGDYGNNAGAAAVAQLVNSLAVDFIVTTGDNMYGTTPIDDQIGNKYSSYIGTYHGAYGAGSATNRFWPSIGNHEYAGEGGGVSAYRDYFTLPGNELYYDFVVGPVHFFAIDSNSQQPDGQSSTSVQAQWLQSELATSMSPYKIVFFHHPPYNSGNDHGSTTTMRWPFEEWGATAVLSGHEHVYERVHRDDNLDGTILPYFITGLGGASRYGFGTPIEGSQVRFADDWGTMLIQASADSITFEFIAVTGGAAGALIDSYTIDFPVQAASIAVGSEPEIFALNAPEMFKSWIDPSFGEQPLRMQADPVFAYDSLF